METITSQYIDFLELQLCQKEWVAEYVASNYYTINTDTSPQPHMLLICLVESGIQHKFPVKLREITLCRHLTLTNTTLY